MPTESTFQVNEHKIMYTEYTIFIPLPKYIPLREVHDTTAGMSSLQPYYESYFYADPKPSGSHHMETLIFGFTCYIYCLNIRKAANYPSIKKIK